MSEKKPPAAAPGAGRAAWFWPGVGLLAVLLVMIQTREISRPFYGLHSWARAHGAWLGRVHERFGLAKTKGLATWVVGETWPEKPHRYLDHPQLLSLLNAVECTLFGSGEASCRARNTVRTLLALLVVMLILRRLADDRTVLLAGLVYVLLPITGFFGAMTWLCPTGWLAVWAYLAAIGAYRDAPEPKGWHKWLLGAAELAAMLMSWEGFFFCLGIGVHYVARCIVRRQWPQRTLLAILIAAPLLGIAIDLTIMAAGWGWDFQRMIDLFVWRSAGGTGSDDPNPFTWARWWERFWQFAGTNFTWPVLVAAGLYLALGPVRRLTGSDRSGWKTGPWTLHLPGLGLLLLPAAFQLLILKAALRPHQYWERPLSPFLALCAAMALWELYEVAKDRGRAVAGGVFAVAVGAIVLACSAGVNHYYYIRWQAPSKIAMLKLIRENLEPNQALLSFEPFTIEEHKAKGKHYRPEIAYYLDREVVPAQKLEDILAKARTGRYPLYLMPTQYGTRQITEYLGKLAAALAKHYSYVRIAGERGHVEYETDALGRVTKRTFYRAGMPTYLLFDLRQPAGQGPSGAVIPLRLE